MTPFPPFGPRARGVCWVPFPEAAEEVLARTGVEGANDGFELALYSWLRFFWRCAMGNMGSGCFGFRRGSRKKLLVFEPVDELGAVLPRIRSELSSDLEDSDNLVPGSGSGGC